jgi:hypothetical protein
MVCCQISRDSCPTPDRHNPQLRIFILVLSEYIPNLRTDTLAVENPSMILDP